VSHHTDPGRLALTPEDPDELAAAERACYRHLDGATLGDVLMMLDLLPSPPPRRPGRNAYGQLRGRA
jgi:hypothetical protein